MDWFRHYHGCAFDPKWRTVTRRANSSIPVVVFVWDTLMEAASEADDRGSIEEWDAEVVADHLGLDPDEIRRVVSAMSDIGVIIGNRLKAWDKRQPADPTAAERMRRHRERKRAEANGHDPDGSKPSRRNDRNATVTQRHELHQNRTDKNRESPPVSPPPGEKPPGNAYHWSGKVIRLTKPDFDRWAMSFHELNLAAHLVDLDEWMASPKVTDAERKRWFQAVAGALRKRHDRAVNERKAADQKRTAQTSAVTDAQRRREAEERCRAEGINPQTREGLARVAELARAAA